MKKILAIILVLLTGCAAPLGQASPVSVAQVTMNELPVPDWTLQNPNLGIVAKGANAFAFKLSAALAEQTGDRSLVCSPYSVWLPLAALVNATDNAAHRDKLLTALGAAGVSTEDLNLAASRMLYDLTNQRDKQYAGEITPHEPLQIANAIFLSNRVMPRMEFAQTFMDSYRGAVMRVDFGSPKAVTAVNHWASENTGGLIPELVQTFSEDTVAAMANAIYFSDRWQWEFDPAQTKEDVFHAPAGDTTAFFMRREGDNQLYYEDERVQAMPLRFKTGGNMWILLPKDGDASGLLQSMTDAYFTEVQEDAVFATGRLLLPRFSIAGDVMELKDSLEALGIPLFDATAAPLKGLILEDLPVWLSGAMHKAVIEVDEKGTTAAAVTIIPAPGAMPLTPTEPFAMDCDRPFVFILCKDTIDAGAQVLFTGIVNTP